MPPLQTNATLTKVAGKGTSEWRQAVGAGTQKWAGAERIYYRERTERVPNGTGGVDVLEVRTLILGGDTAVDELLDTDDVVSWTTDDGEAMTGSPRVITRARLAGFGPELATTRVELQAR